MGDEGSSRRSALGPGAGLRKAHSRATCGDPGQAMKVVREMLVLGYRGFLAYMSLGSRYPPPRWKAP